MSNGNECDPHRSHRAPGAQPEITLDGDEAQVIWAMQDRVVRGPERPSIVGYGHYHERWVRHDGAWRLAALRLTRLHLDVLPTTQR